MTHPCRWWLVPLAVLVGACSSGVSGFSTTELCGSSPADFNVSPQPLFARTSGDSFAVPGAITIVGSPPSGALADLLTSMGWTQDAHASFELRIEDAATLSEISRTCGDSLPAATGSYALAIKPGSVLVAGAPEGQANAFATLAQLLSSGNLPRASILDGPALSQRFVLEGFYGPPWTWAQRHQVLHAAAAEKLNTYVYAPKGDYISRFFWQQPYDSVALADIQTFAADVASLAMRLCWEISPGGAITFSDPTQRQEMEAKFQSLMSVGVSCFALAFDDTPMTLSAADQAVYPSFAAGELAFVTAMDTYLKSLPGDVRLFGVTGNTYSTGMMQAYPSYVATLATLDPTVDIGWTGLDIVSGEVLASDVALATTLLARPPALGDNYPVSGEDLVSGPLNLWPIDGRDPGAIAALGAYGSNGMTLARASIPAFASIAELAWDPPGYDPARAFVRGLQLAAGSDSSGMDFFARLTDGLNETGTNAAPELRAALDEYGYDSTGGAPGLAAFFQRMSTISSELTAINPELLAELQPWITKAQDWGQLGGAVLTALQMPAGSVSADQIAMFQTQLGAVLVLPSVIADGPMQAFVSQGIAKLEAQ